MNELQTVFLQFIKKVSKHIKAHFFTKQSATILMISYCVVDFLLDLQ